MVLRCGAFVARYLLPGLLLLSQHQGHGHGHLALLCYMISARRWEGDSAFYKTTSIKEMS